MGRSKLKIEFIQNVKTRQITFKKMKENLIKKAYELRTLCDVDVSIITFPPNTDNDEQLQQQPPQIWPQGSDKLLSHIEEFKKQLPEDKMKRTVEVDSYLEKRCKKLEDAIIEQRKKNYDVIYPSWNPCYNDLSEEQLVKIASDLEYKLQQSSNTRLGKYGSQPDYHHQSEFIHNQQYIPSNLVNNVDNQYLFDDNLFDDNLTFDYEALVGGGDDEIGTTDVNNMLQNNASMQYQCPVNPMDMTKSPMQNSCLMDTTMRSMMQYQYPVNPMDTTESLMQYQCPIDTTTGFMRQYQYPTTPVNPIDTTGSMMQYQYPTTTLSPSSSIFNNSYSGSCNEAQLLYHPPNQMSG